MPASARLIDVNAAIGPWPHGDCPELDVALARRALDRLGIEQALVHHSTAGCTTRRSATAGCWQEIEDEPRLLPASSSGRSRPASSATRPRSGTLDAAGVRAVRVYPRDHGWTLAGHESELLFRTVAAAGLPVFVDLVQTDWRAVSALAARQPELRLVVCSVGYRELRVLLPLLDRHPNLACDLSYFAAHQGVEVVVRRFGAGRLLFGTGMPVAEPAGAVACLAWADLDDGARAAIGSENAARLLGLEAPATVPPRPVAATVADAALETMLDGQPLRELDVFDVHGHLGAWFAFWLPEQGVEPIVARLDRCGVGAIAVSSLLGVGPDARTGNEETVAAARETDGRIFVYAVANPHRPDLGPTLERQLELPEVVGLKIHPDTHTCPADDPAYDWVWQLAERTESVVLSHTFADTPWSDPRRFDGIAERFPSVRVILAHAGVTPDGFRRSIDVCGRHPRLVVDTSRLVHDGPLDPSPRRGDRPGAGPVRLGHALHRPALRPRPGDRCRPRRPDTRRLVLGGNARALLGTQPASVHTTLQGG